MNKSFLYVIESNGFRKIGMADDPKVRLACLQTGSPVKLNLENAVSVFSAFVKQGERKAHEMLSDKRLRGEWFSCSKEEALDAIKAGRQYSDGLLFRMEEREDEEESAKSYRR